MKRIFQNIVSVIKTNLVQMRDKLHISNKKGFIMIMATVVIPTVMLLLYLMVQNSGRSEQRIAFEQATKNATLDTARKYVQGRTFAKQSAYLDRIAAVSFDNAVKNTIGITNNIIPLTITTKGYGLSGSKWEYDVDTYDAYGSGGVQYYNRTTVRYMFLTETWVSWNTNPFSSVIDPDADTIDSAYVPGDTIGEHTGYLLFLSNSGSYNQKKIVSKSSEASENTINVTRIDDDTIQVETNVTINNRNYATSYKAKAPELNADIVLGIPVNTAASTTDNNPYGTAVWNNSTYRSTPLWQIKDECRDFVKKLLSYRKCAIGLIPYCGEVVVPFGTLTTVDRDPYKYSDYAAVNPSIPIAEAYKFIAEDGGRGTALNTNITSTRDITPFMYRSDLEEYLTTYMNDGTTNQTEIESLLYGEVNNDTEFMAKGSKVVYGGAANIMAGYSRCGMATYPQPYPMYGLTQDPMMVYRYLALVAPFADQFHRSSFAYLPIMFGMSMLSNGFQNHLTAAQQASFDTDHSSRKKAIVLICNQADLWFPRELTYFGFVNDASYIPMVDGDRLDYEKGTLEDAGDGYYRSKIYRSTDVVYDTGNYNNSIDKPGMFFNEYDEKVAIKSNYTKDSTSGTYSVVMPKPGNTKIVLDATNVEGEMEIDGNPYNSTISSITCQSVSGDTSSAATSPYTVTRSGTKWTCKVPNGGSSGYIEYKVNFTKRETSNYFLQVKMRNCELVCNNSNDTPLCEKLSKNTLETDSRICLMQTNGEVAICRTDSTYNPTTVILKVKFIADYTGMNQYKALVGEMQVSAGTSGTTISSVQAVSDASTPSSSDNIWKCSAFPAYDSVYKVNFTKTDSSPVVLKLKLKGCELVTNGANDYTLKSNSNFCARQDGTYVYICRISGSATSVELQTTCRPLTDTKKVDYPSINGEMKVYKGLAGGTGDFTSINLTNVTHYSGGSTPTSSSSYWTCTVPPSATDSSPVEYTFQYTKSGISPVVAKLDLAQCEIVSFSDSNYDCRQWDNHVYIIEKTAVSNGTSKSFRIKLRSKLTPTHGGDLIQYLYIYGRITFQAPGDHGSVTISKIETSDAHSSGDHGDVPIDKEYAEYKVTFSKSDTSPVVLKLTLQNAELVTNGSGSDYTLLSDSNFRVRQDANYVYICRTGGSATNVTIRVKYAFGTNGTTTGATQYPYLSYFHDKLSPSTGDATYTWWGGVATYTADRAFNVKVSPKVDMSTEGLTSETALTNDSPVNYNELCVNYRFKSKSYWNENYSLTDSTSAYTYLAAMGIEESLTGNYHTDYLNGIDRIEATWNGINNKVPHWDDGDANTHSISFGFGTDFVFAPVDGDRATDANKNAVKDVIEYVKIVEKDGAAANQTIDRWATRRVVNLASLGISSCKVEIKFNSSVIKNPVICDVRFPMGAYIEEIGGSISASNYLLERSDDNYYYLVPSINFSGTGYVYVKERPNNTTTTTGGCWELAYVNNHYLGYSNEFSTGQYSNYTFASSGHEGPGLKSDSGNSGYGGGLRCYPYWIYGRAAKIKVISKDHTQFYKSDEAYDGLCMFSPSNNVYKNAKLRALRSTNPTTETSDGIKYTYYKFRVQHGNANVDGYTSNVSYCAISGYKIQPYTSTISRTFQEFTYTEGVGLRSFNWKTDVSRTFVYNCVSRSFQYVTTSISFSGNYSKSYSTLAVGKYHVIYIPRSKFSGTLGTNDSATINFTLNGAKVVYIEWSNHLNGTEGAYPRDDADDLRTKDLHVGTSADSSDYGVWYEKFTRSKNASARFYDDPSQDEYGDPTLFTGTETYGWARPTSALGDSYVYVVNNYNNNSSYKRSRQVANLRHQAGYSETYDYPRWHGDLSYIFENTVRNSGIHAWSYGNSTHMYEFNYMNCIGRYCSLYERFEDYNIRKGTEMMGIALNTSNVATWGVSGNVNWVARIGLAESTVDANRILMAADYQSINSSNYVVYDSTWRMRNTITPKMVEAFNSKFGANGRIYVIHYRYDPAGKNGWSADLGGVYKNYTAADQTELKSTLNVILMDIKKWAGYQDAKIVD